MTLQRLPQEQTVWIPTAGYHLACLENDAARQRTLDEAWDEYWKDYWQRCDDWMQEVYPKPPPNWRLAFYHRKPVEPPPLPPPVVDPKTGAVVQQPAPAPSASWHEQRARFPDDFQDDMADWVQLEPVSVIRDVVLRQLAVIDALETGQQAMSGGGTFPLQGNPPPAFSPPEAPPALPWPPAGGPPA